MTTIEYRVYDPANATYLGSLTRAYGKSYVDAVSSPGMGRFSIDADDSQAALVQHRRVVRVRVDGTDRFAFLMDETPRDETGDGNEPPAIAVSGPGLAGWLGSGRGGALIYPRRWRTRMTDRHFGWQSLEYGRPAADGWVWAGTNHTFGRQEKPTSKLPKLVGQPEGWPDRRAEWLTHRPGEDTASGGYIHSGSNEGLFVRHLPATGADTPARIFVAGTNEWDLYLDGERIAGGRGFRDVVETDVVLENRTLPLAVHLRHDRTPGYKWDAMAFILTVQRLTSDGRLAGTMFRSYTPSLQAKPAPPSTWRVLADPAEHPGLTPGQVLGPLIAEAKARGALGSLGTATWNHVTDSNGAAWDTQMSHGFPILSKLSDVLDQVVGIAGVEYAVTPVGELLVANRIGVARTGAFAPLVSARTSGEGPQATVVVGQAEDGYLERSDTAGVTEFGRIEDGATFGTVPARASLRQPLDRMLAQAARVRDERDYVLSESSPQPYVAFGVGDSYADGRITQLTMTQDDASGAVEWAVSLLPEG